MTVEDILSIKDDLVEDRPREHLTRKAVQWMIDAGYAFTYWKDDQVVACCWAYRLKIVEGKLQECNNWDLMAFYSKKFSAFAFARIDAALAFCKRFKALWDEERQVTGSTATFGIPSDLKGGAKYAKMIGGVYMRTEPSELTAGVTNDIYEVVQ